MVKTRQKRLYLLLNYTNISNYYMTVKGCKLTAKLGDGFLQATNENGRLLYAGLTPRFLASERIL